MLNGQPATHRLAEMCWNRNVVFKWVKVKRNVIKCYIHNGLFGKNKWKIIINRESVQYFESDSKLCDLLRLDKTGNQEIDNLEPEILL